MINFSLMGAGRIGKMHAKFIAAHPKAKLKYIYDVNSQFAEEVAKSTGCSIASVWAWGPSRSMWAHMSPYC